MAVEGRTLARCDFTVLPSTRCDTGEVGHESETGQDAEVGRPVGLF